MNYPSYEENPAKLILEVRAGVMPGAAMAEYTKRWALTFDEWEDRVKVLKVYGEAQEYAVSLWNPQLVNWVRLDWVWL